MRSISSDPRANGSWTKKLLRFGTAHPQCAICKSPDERCLCRMKTSGLILCRNCNAKRKPFSPRAKTQKARRFRDAGYFKPTCVICKSPSLQVLELDHMANEANSNIMAPLCANHHAIKSYMAESGPMAGLRRRDPQRSALVLQAAFDLGLGAVLSMFAVWDGAHEETARSVLWGIAAGALIAWALWNLAAHTHFENVLGPGYDRAIMAEVPS
jgi:hypothetical protein